MYLYIVIYLAFWGFLFLFCFILIFFPRQIYQYILRLSEYTSSSIYNAGNLIQRTNLQHWAGFRVNQLAFFINSWICSRSKWLAWWASGWHAEIELSVPTVMVEAYSSLWHCDISVGKVTPQLRTLTLPQISRAITANLSDKTVLSLGKDVLLGMSLMSLWLLPSYYLHFFACSLMQLQKAVPDRRSQGLKRTDLPGPRHTILLLPIVFYPLLYTRPGD